jgi:hypothetical protein
MQWLRFSSLLLSAALAVSCARPSVEDDALGVGSDAEDGSVSAGDDDGEATSATERDAGSTSSPKDAGHMATADAGGPAIAVADAGCADRDRDKVCDVDDNCPTEANPNQADGDGDGTGDACTSAPTTCNGEPIPADVDLGLAKLQSVRVNGIPGAATVRPGSKVTVRLSLTFSSCGIVGSFRQVLVGVEAGDVHCGNRVYCNEYAMLSQDFEFTLDAPTELGLHYVGVSVEQSACNSEAEPQFRIAALCVER